MNRLSLGRRTQVINCLVEGNSIRSTRITPAMAAGVSDTVWSLEELVDQATK